MIYYLDSSDLGEDGGLGLECCVLAQSGLSLSSQLSLGLDGLVVLGGSLGSLGGELLDELLALPADLRSQISKDAELSLGSQTERLDGLRDGHLLLLVIRSWYAIENLEAL